MGNDNKIGYEIDNKAEVRLFLNDELLPLEKSHRVSTYNLTTEYARTRKNRSYFVWLLMTICFVSVILITTLVVRHLSVQNKKIEVDTSVFSDLDMTSMLKSRSHIQMEYLVAENESSRLQQEFDSKMENALNKRNSDLQFVTAMRFENSDARKNAVLSAYKKEINSIHAEYDDKLAQATAKTGALKVQMDEMDKQNMENIDSVSFDDQLQQHERTFIVNSYEETISGLEAEMKRLQSNAFLNQQATVRQLGNKYHAEVDALDPALKDDQANQIITSAPEKQDISFNDFLSALPQSVLTNDFLTGLQNTEKLFGNYTYIHNAIEEIPQKKSMASYKDSENRLVLGMLHEFGKAVYSQIASLNTIRLNLEAQRSELQTRKAELESQTASLESDLNVLQKKYDVLNTQYNGVSGNLSMFNSWFEMQAAEENSSGYILDISNTNRMSVFVVKRIQERLLSGEDSIAIKVYHGKRRNVSDGIVGQQNGIFYYTPTDSKGADIEAGDRLVIPIKK